jgi:hypothetical protein
LSSLAPQQKSRRDDCRRANKEERRPVRRRQYC